MATTRSLRMLIGILAISAWMLGSALPGEAATLNYKSYVWMNRSDSVEVDDAEGHTVSLAQRGGFYAFDTGEIATIKRVSLNDLTKGTGTATTYETIKFSDGSTIVLKSQSTMSRTGGQTTASEGTGDIIKGTGRFAGIQGTARYARRFLPAEKGEAGSKQYGEGTLTYTLPPK